VLRHS